MDLTVEQVSYARAFTAIRSLSFLPSCALEPSVLWDRPFGPSSSLMAQQRGNLFDHLRPQIRSRPKLDESKGNNDACDKSKNEKAFDPREPFLLTDLVGDLNSSTENSNYFHFPPGAATFLRRVLSSGPVFQFVPMDRSIDCKKDEGGNDNSSDNADTNNRVAFISSCLDCHDIHINLLAFPPQRVGEAICHELLHHEDFRTSGFRPITSLVYCKPARLRGVAAAATTTVCQDAPPPTKAFQPMIAKLVNLISHEYVKARLEGFGYSEPFVPAMDNQLASLRFVLQNLEMTMCSLSEQLAKVGGGGVRAGQGKQIKVGIYKLQSVYEDLVLVVLMDELLFLGAYANQIDAMLLRRFQHILDYVLDCTSRSSGVPECGYVATVVRNACKRYRAHASAARAEGAVVGDAKDRYTLLAETLNATYDAVGVQFVVLNAIPGKDEAPRLRIEDTSGVLRGDESFLLDGEYSFVNAKSFVALTSEEFTGE